jgi:excisionase family DNA binding protein
MGQNVVIDRQARIMNVHEVADYLRISEAKVYRMAKAGDMPVIRMGKSWRFRSDLIDEWIRRQAEQAYQPSK